MSVASDLALLFDGAIDPRKFENINVQRAFNRNLKAWMTNRLFVTLPTEDPSIPGSLRWCIARAGSTSSAIDMHVPLTLTSNATIAATSTFFQSEAGVITTNGHTLTIGRDAPHGPYTRFVAGAGEVVFSSGATHILYSAWFSTGDTIAEGIFNAGNIPLWVKDDWSLVWSGLVMPSTSAIYFGSPTTDGSWRIIRSGNDLEMQRRESSTWVNKLAATP